MSVLERAYQAPEFLRKQRQRLFKAFDIYKENVNFGIESVSEERKAEIIEWYEQCLDLDFNAINNYPEELNKYLPK